MYLLLLYAQLNSDLINSSEKYLTVSLEAIPQEIRGTANVCLVHRKIVD